VQIANGLLKKCHGFGELKTATARKGEKKNLSNRRFTNIGRKNAFQVQKSVRVFNTATVWGVRGSLLETWVSDLLL
jgi:hypothetical protein